MHRNPYPHPHTPPTHPTDRVVAGKHIRVAVDVMGGDHAPDAILKGCVMALEDLPEGDQLVLVGPAALIREMLAERSIKDGDPRIEIVDAPTTIDMGDSAVEGV
jgi:glycerol-3-phosphate acyltransferase PlsX